VRPREYECAQRVPAEPAQEACAEAWPGAAAACAATATQPLPMRPPPEPDAEARAPTAAEPSRALARAE
jgi:hypothetical protein